MATNITEAHRDAFNALISGEFCNFALVSCFVNGAPTSAIAAVSEHEGMYALAPLFVAVTEQMVLTDHEGVEA